VKMTDLFLGELERETASTRRTLERVPEGRYDWKPHDKSMVLGYLAELVARLPSWAVLTIKQDHLDLTTYKSQPLRTNQELLKEFDASVAGAREALANTTDEHLLAPWRFVVGGQVVDESPRHVMIADSVFSHLAHHRGQLTVYLRLKEESFPEICEPSANEGLVA
jgi:uncharacterized damage-inducible protein DinB